ncbi:hypothetical protein KTN05_17110 [Paracoccus sp. Z118]|uniref:hypothetical protein n=1 Tax=Paracoccus sp. Z118 TaxID=2851017 RepID=UPI001C2BF83F|nr:hypothetical protein [Paracoccus sp. Z118]MBV0893509.1 hypothetical protein [Paracoccus sp. Z118]
MRATGAVAALGHAVGDLEIFGRVVAGRADAFGHSGETVLIPGDLLRQVGDHDDALVLDAHGAAGLALRWGASLEVVRFV